VLGVDVHDHLRTRRDRRGALVLLEDGRYAVTGPLVAVGGASQLQRYARRRLADENDEAARAWWQEVIGALAR
jgi:potassium/hydrogen antiporter